MNRAIGIMCLRPLVGSLAAIVAAILLYASNHANAQAPPSIGIMYLEDSDAVGDPIHDWIDDPALTNPFVQGIALRTQWGRVEPHEHANANDFLLGLSRSRRGLGGRSREKSFHSCNGRGDHSAVGI